MRFSKLSDLCQLNPNFALKFDIHILHDTTEESTLTWRWFRAEHLTEVLTVLKPIAEGCLENSDSVFPSGFDSSTFGFENGLLLQIVYFFKYNPFTHGSCVVLNSSESRGVYNSVKVSNITLIASVCLRTRLPIETQKQLLVSQLKKFVGKQAIASTTISSYFKKGKSSTLQQKRKGATESHSSVDLLDMKKKKNIEVVTSTGSVFKNGGMAVAIRRNKSSVTKTDSSDSKMIESKRYVNESMGKTEFTKDTKRKNDCDIKSDVSCNYKKKRIRKSPPLTLKEEVDGVQREMNLFASQKSMKDSCNLDCANSSIEEFDSGNSFVKNNSESGNIQMKDVNVKRILTDTYEGHEENKRDMLKRLSKAHRTPLKKYSPIFTSSTKKLLDDLLVEDDTIEQLTAKIGTKNGNVLNRNRKEKRKSSFVQTETSTDWFSKDSGFEQFENLNRKHRIPHRKISTAVDTRTRKERTKMERGRKKKILAACYSSQLTLVGGDSEENVSKTVSPTSNNEKSKASPSFESSSSDSRSLPTSSVYLSGNCSLHTEPKNIRKGNLTFESDTDEDELPFFDIRQVQSDEGKYELPSFDVRQMHSDDVSALKASQSDSELVVKSPLQLVNEVRRKRNCSRKTAALGIFNSSANGSDSSPTHHLASSGVTNETNVGKENADKEIESDDSDLPAFDVRQVDSVAGDDVRQTAALISVPKCGYEVEVPKVLLHSENRRKNSSTQKDGWQINEEIHAVEDVKNLSDEHLSYLLKINHKYLKDIVRGKIYSDRHQEFCKGGMTRVHLIHRVFISLYTDAQVEFVLQKLSCVTGKNTPKYLDYNFKVLLTEALIKMLMDCKSLSYEDAEKMLFEGRFEGLE